MASKVVLFFGALSFALGACSLLVDTSGLSGGGAKATDSGLETSVRAGIDAAADSPAVDIDASTLTDYAKAILADRPIAYYRFEEASGTVAADSAGGGFDAIYGSAVHLGVPGLAGGGLAAEFDGAPDGGFDNFVHRAATPGLQPTAITVEAWVLLNTADQAANLVSYGKDSTAPFEAWVLQLYNGIPSAYVTTANGTPPFAGAASALTVGVPHHLAMTYDGQTLLVFADGIQVAATQRGSGALSGYDSTGFGIGCGAEATRNVFNGVIDEVAIYDRALSPVTILQHVQLGAR